MMTLNFAMIVMMVGSSMMPMNMDIIYAPMVNSIPKIEMVKDVVTPAAPIVNKPAMTTPLASEESAVGINQDKTYEQCMQEAFERIYAEVNRLLDQIPDMTDEQYQLRRMM